MTLVASSFFAYQEWQKSQDYFGFENVQSLSETSKIQSISAPEGKRLVPIGAIMGVNDVNEVYFTYFVDVESGKNLNVEISRAFFTKNGDVFEDSYGLMQFDIVIEMISDLKAEVHICITLSMPKTEEIANLIYGSSASFQMLFNQIDIK